MAATNFVIQASEPFFPGLTGFIEFYGNLPNRSFTIDFYLEGIIMLQFLINIDQT